MKIIECPRDAMQGIHDFIPTSLKIDYINLLLQVGFDTIDFGSFVSPKAIPQMADTADVLKGLDLSSTKSKLLAIVANIRGVEAALAFEEISYLGFPLSLSETFQQRNTNKSIEEAMQVVSEAQDQCMAKGRSLVVYLSMGFGNPYGDPYSVDYVLDYVKRLDELGVSIISLADTVGVARPEEILPVFSNLLDSYSNIEFGAHLHAAPHQVKEKMSAVLESGCNRIDGALRGFGGCPMAEDDLVGNVATEQIIELIDDQHDLRLDREALSRCQEFSYKIFS